MLNFSVLVYWEALHFLSKIVLHFILFFPILEKEALHLEVEEDNHWASIESMDMHE